MKSDIFHSALIKTTLLYLTIIICISGIFSVGLYRVSSEEIARSALRKQGPINQILRTNNPEIINNFLDSQREAVNEGKNRLKGNLIFLNLMILVSGGLLSYFLARKTLDPIEKAHEAQSRFTADASHELRTPITAMRIETELTLTDPKLNLKSAKKQLESNIEELDKLTSLSEGLLQLARIDNNGMVLDETSVDVVIDEAISRTMKKAKLQKIDISNKNKLKTKIQANQNALIEAIITILDNAIKYSPKNSKVIIKTKKSRSNVCISIIDTGIGIPQTDIPFVFDRFYRSDSSRTKDETHGYGIGLSIAKSVIEAHSGKIEIKSELDKGSTFTISLPT